MFEETLSMAIAPDLAIFLLLAAILIIYAVVQGTGLLISVAIALPISAFLYSFFPYHAEMTTALPAMLQPWAAIILFIVFTLFILWVLQRTIGLANGSDRPIHIVATAIALTLLIVAFTYHVIPIEGIYDFGSAFDDFFESSATFFWIVALVLLAFFVV